MPRGIPNKTLESQEQTIGQDTYLDMPTTGPLAGMIRTDQQVDIVTEPMKNDYLDQLAFAEELVDVIVHESTDKNAEPLVDVYVNGTPQRFMRGQVQTVKRKYLEVLARAKQTSISTSVQRTDEDVYNRINKHTALRYPFAVQHDPNPRGQQWLKNILAQA